MIHAIAPHFRLRVVLEKATGQPYEQLMTERVFIPLGMTSTSIINQAALQSGHQRSGVAARVPDGLRRSFAGAPEAQLAGQHVPAFQ